MAEFDERVEGRTCVLHVTGELDMAVADDFHDRVVGCLDDSDAVVVDLSGVTFMDSSGVGALARLRKAATTRDKEVVLQDPSPTADRLLRLTRVRDLFRIVSSGADDAADTTSGGPTHEG
jgi:anti-anti-sigma factor